MWHLCSRYGKEVTLKKQGMKTPLENILALKTKLLVLFLMLVIALAN